MHIDSMNEKPWEDRLRKLARVKPEPVRFLAVIAVALLCGCSTQDDTICETPPLKTDLFSSSCIHRTAYQYAHVKGPNAELARAVVAQCSSLLLDELTNGPLKAPPELLDENYVGRLKLMQEDALNRIVQAKAGNCAKPD